MTSLPRKGSSRFYLPEDDMSSQRHLYEFERVCSRFCDELLDEGLTMMKTFCVDAGLFSTEESKDTSSNLVGKLRSYGLVNENCFHLLKFVANSSNQSELLTEIEKYEMTLSNQLTPTESLNPALKHCCMVFVIYQSNSGCNQLYYVSSAQFYSSRCDGRCETSRSNLQEDAVFVHVTSRCVWH